MTAGPLATDATVFHVVLPVLSWLGVVATILQLPAIGIENLRNFFEFTGFDVA